MTRFNTTLALLFAAAVVACGSLPPGVNKAKRQLAKGDYAGAEKTAVFELNRYPKHPTLWRVRIQAAMGERDNARAATLYKQWFELRGSRHDRRALRLMAMTMMWQGLRVPSDAVRTRTIQAVERLEIEDLAQDVSKLVVHHSDRVAAAAAVALLKADRAAAKVVTDALRSDDERARVIAVEGIGRKVGARARDDISRMTKDSAPAVRRAAVTAIGNFASNEDTALLTHIAKTDSDGSVRATALRALGKGKRGDLLAVANAALEDKYLGARLSAVQLLAKQGQPGRDVLQRLTKHSDRFVALRAISLLGTDARDRSAVTAGLGDTAWEVRVAAIGTVAAANRVASLGPLLADAKVEVRVAAARALLDTSLRARAIDTLARATSDADDMVRLQAARNLVRAKDPRGIQTITALLSSSRATTRSAAISAHVGAHTISLALVRALADESAQLRIEAAEALLTI